MRALKNLWGKIQEPKVITVVYFIMYVLLTVGGVAALVDPPTSIQGEVGQASMILLAGLLAFGGGVGAFAVLPGVWWLERTAVLSIGLSLVLYGFIVIALHFTSSGNRVLQFTVIGALGLLQIVRWHRIRVRPYDPARATPVV